MQVVASKNQVPGLSVSGPLVENGLVSERSSKKGDIMIVIRMVIQINSLSRK